MKKVTAAFNIFVCAMMGVLACYLGLLSFHSTAVVMDGEEVFFGKNVMGITGLVASGVMLVSVLLFYPGLISKDKRNNLLTVINIALSFVPFFISIYWVGIAKSIPAADQGILLSLTEKFDMGDFSMFAKEEYIGADPHQIGLFLLEWLFGKVFGQNNYRAVQYLNCFFVLGVTHLLGRIGMEIGLSRAGKTIVYILVALFLPLPLYATFCYGNLPGVMFTLLALLMSYKITDCPKWSYFLILFMSTALSIMLKKNFVIAYIAIAIYVAFVMLRDHAYRRSGILLAVMFVAICLASSLPKLYVEKVTGIEVGSGESSWAYIAMGLQNSEYAEGWFNGYNQDTYKANGYNTELQAAEAKEYIGNRIKEFAADGQLRRNFFVNKTASQWAEPTFQSIWVSGTRYHDEPLGKHATWVYSFSGQRIIRNVLAMMQIVVWIGVLFSVLCSNSALVRYKQLPLQLYVIGGFIFHLFWEAKAQYIWTYFIFLLPVSVVGYIALSGRIREAVKDDNKKQFRRIGSVFGIILLTLVLFLVLPVTKDLVTPDNGRSFDSYAKAYECERVLEDGFYYVKPIFADSLYLAIADDGRVLLTSDESVLHITYYDSTVKMENPVSNNCLTYGGDSVIYGCTNTRNNLQQWRIEEIENDGYLIEYGPYKTMTVGASLTLESIEADNIYQKWHIVKALMD